MIYQARRNKALLFERVIKVTVHLVPSDGIMIFYYNCLCRCDKQRGYILRVLNPVREPPLPIYYYGRPLHEDIMGFLREQDRIVRNARRE